MTNQRGSVIIFISTLSLLSACAAKQPFLAFDHKANAHAKQISISGFAAPTEGILITCINGTDTDNYFGGYGNQYRYPDRVAVLEGRHSFSVIYFNGPNFVQTNLWLDALEGEAYKLVKEAEGYRVNIVIEESHSKKQVGGTLNTVNKKGRIPKSC